MIRLASLLLIIMCGAASAWSQGKGIDKTSERVRDAGTAAAMVRIPTPHRRGMDFGKGRLTNAATSHPYRISARRDAILSAIADVMRDRKLIIDDAASKPSDGIIVSQPYTFIKGR